MWRDAKSTKPDIDQIVLAEVTIHSCPNCQEYRYVSAQWRPIGYWEEIGKVGVDIAGHVRRWRLISDVVE